MRSSIVLTILRKELKETLRDRRTLLMMLGMPVLVYPLLMVGLTRLQESQTQASESRASTVAVWGDVAPALSRRLAKPEASIAPVAWNGVSDAVRRAITNGTAHPADPVIEADEDREGGPPPTPSTTLRETENPVLASARDVLTSRRADAVIVVWPGFEQALAEHGLSVASIYFDSVREDSRLARERVLAVLRAYRDDVVRERERSQHLREGFSVAVDLRERDVSPASRRAAFVLGSILPFLIVSLSLFGGFYAAVDLTAGEKERGTMQTLLCAPVRSIEIVAGKFLTVWIVATVAALANIASLGATMARILPSGATAVPASKLALVALMLLPITFTVAALFVAVATFAKDFKDGQNFLTPLYMFLALPAGVTMLPSTELDAWTAFVPMVNIALVVKAVLAGEVRGELVFLVLASSALFAALALVLAARVFNREQVLLGGSDSATGLLGLDRTGARVPSPSMAIVLYAIVLVLTFYASLALQDGSIVRILLVTQYGLMLAPVVAAIAWFRFHAPDTLSLRAPSVAAVLTAAVVGACAWVAVAGLTVPLMPPPESLAKSMERLIKLGDTAQPLWVVWLVLAVTPAFCEELLFRGFILSGLRRFGRWPAVLGSALLFAVAHASIYRLLPTLVLGIILALVVWHTRSIVAGMVIHALNNGVVATLAQRPDLAALFGMASDATQPPPAAVAVSAAIVIAGLLLLTRLDPSPLRDA